ncbi:MAG: hypothetical protein J0L91_00515 [Burkholderiales bacterium]|nr:hypothetical protein [Burkholderiales bacterium]
MSARTGGELVVASLIAQGATHLFGVPGESYLPVLDALVDARGRLAFVTCRQEGGAAMMAEAVGKLTGRPGVAIVTRGPGASNAAIGVHVARQDSTPMVLLVGQVGTDFAGREAFQEVDYGQTFGSLAKAVVDVGRADRIPECIARAWHAAMSGRPASASARTSASAVQRTACRRYCSFLCTRGSASTGRSGTRACGARVACRQGEVGVAGGLLRATALLVDPQRGVWARIASRTLPQPPPGPGRVPAWRWPSCA